MKNHRQIPASLTTVTRLSKAVALLLYFVMLALGFWAGVHYERDQQAHPQPAPLIRY
jgi:positive regulator of sigma E activity